ncbi:unnamed protein product [Closterium sp. NIES-65]|nr:unnamed protein product [Closterium sp. NIES-65]
MATPSVLAFDAEGRAIDFEVWVDDLQLFLQCDRADGLSLFDLTSDASPAPAADADPTVRSQWATRDAVARLAVRRHLPTTERAHFSQYKSAHTLYDAVVARYSSPATAALSRLMLSYLFPDLAAFPTVADLITHLRTSDTRYRAALPAEFCSKNPPPMYITLYYIVTRLPDSLRVVRDHFLSVCPTTLTVDLLEKALLAAEKTIVAVGASRGDPRTPIFEGRSVRRLPLVGDAALARARGARARVELAGVVEVAVEAAEGVGVAVGVVAGVEVSMAAVEAEAAEAAAVLAEAAVVAEVEEAVVEEVAVVGVALCSGAALVVVSASRSSSSSRALGTFPPPQQLREWYAHRLRGGGFGPCTYVLRSGDRAGEQCGGAHPTQRCFGRLTNAWRQQFPEASEIPRWGELSRAGVAIYDLDFDAILAAMNAVTISDEGDCYRCFPPDPGIGTAALGAGEAAPLGASASAPSGAGESALSDRTTLTPLGWPVAVSLANLSGGPVLSHFSTVLPCPAAPSGTLCGLYLPSFSTNLVSGADLQDAGVHQFAPVRPSPSCVPCVEGRLRAAPHSSQFPPTEAPLQTLHMDVWGPARVRGQGHERYFLLVVDDYSRYTSVFPLCSKGDVTEVLIDWIRAARLQLRRSFGSDFPVLRLHSDRGGEFSSGLLRAYCRPQGIRQTFTLPDSPQQNGIAERRIGMVMDVARTSMMHAAAPHFLWPFAVRYAAHQINLHPRVSMPETSPALLWMGKVGDASAFRVWGSRAFVRDLSADKLSPRAAPCVFLGFPPDSPGWQFYHPSSRRVLSSQDVTFDESVPYYVSSPTALLPSPRRRTSLCQVDAVKPVEVAGDCGTAAGAEPGGANSGGAARVGAEPGGTEPGGATTGGAKPWGPLPGVAASGAAEPGGTVFGAAEPGGAEPAAAGPARVASGGSGPGGSPVVQLELVLLRLLRVLVPPVSEVLALGVLELLRLRVRLESELLSVLALRLLLSVLAAVLLRVLLVLLEVLELERREPASCPASPVRAARASGRGSRHRPPLVPGTHRMSLCPSIAPLRAPLPSPPESSLPALADPEWDSLRAASPTVTRLLATVVTDPSFESTAASALVAQLVDFAARCCLDYAASLVAESASLCPPSVGGECALGTDVLEDRQEEFHYMAAASPHLVSVLLTPEGDPDALDIPTPRSYTEAVEVPYSSQWQAAMDAEMASWKSTGTYVDAVPPPGANIVSGMWIFSVKRPPGSSPVFKARYVARGFSQPQGVDYFQTFSPTPKMTTLRVLLHIAAQRDYKLHSLDFSTAFLQGSLHEEIWLRRPPGFTETFPPGTQWSLQRPVYGLRQAPREWHDTLRTTLAALGFAPSTADPSLFLRTDTSLPLFYILVYVDDLVFATANTAGLAHVKLELQKRHTCTDLGELRSYLGLQITRDRARRTITLTQSHMVQQVLQRFGFTYSSPQATPLPTRHSLSALPSDESVESSGPYPELVGCLMYLMTCTRPDLAYPLSILARYVAPGRHRPEHMAAAKRVLRYLCSTSGMGLVLGGQSPVVLTGHADASWADDQATQRSSQGYIFSLGSGSVSWRATRSSSVLGSSCEAEIYAGAMAA